MTVRKNTKKKKNISSKNTKTKSLKKKIIFLVIKGFAFLISAGALFLFFVYLGLFGKLPGEEDLAKIDNDLASEVYASDGTLMGKYFYQNRMSLENKVISKHVINALVATEDKRFFQHGGFDLISLGRVMVKSVLLMNRSQGGGSTISQQLAKNLYPRKDYGPFSMLVNKSKEMITASRLEDVYSKDQILTLYLNTVPFGEDVYGIESAAMRYFNKHSSDLNAPEAAVLVGMLAANTAYNPRINPGKSKKRRNVVLTRMKEYGFLSEKEYDTYADSDIKLNYHKMDHNTGIAPYFREQIRKQAEKILEEKYGEEYSLYSDGLKIYTSIDPTLQRYADVAVQKHMAALQNEFKIHWKNRDPWKNHPEVFNKSLHSSNRYKALKVKDMSEEAISKEMSKLTKMTVFAYPDEKEVNLSPIDSIKHYLKILNTGFMVMDPHDGKILAWVGGVNHKYFQYDHVLAKRQVGSTFKPIVYTAALLDGMSPCEYISNEQRVYEEYDDWSPANAGGDHEGFYSLQGGLANSVNTITAEIMIRTGVDKVLRLAEDMGVKSHVPAVPSISLGTASISLAEMLTVYSCYANSGYKSEPVGLMKIEDRDGKVLYEYEAPEQKNEVLDEETVQMMDYMLKGVVDRGTGKNLHRVYGLQSQLAGKTGTTQDNADGWFIGFTPNLLGGVWVGAESPVVHFRSTALGQGAHMALPIFGLFMQQVERNPRYRKYYTTSFPSLSEQMAERLDCADFALTDPDRNIFDIFRFGKRNRPDSTTLSQPARRKDRERTKPEKSEEERGGLLKRMKDLFKRK